MVHEGVTRRSEAALSDVTLTGISAVVEKLIGFVYSLPLFVVPVWYRRCDDDVFRFVRGEGKKKKCCFCLLPWCSVCCNFALARA